MFSNTICYKNYSSSIELFLHLSEKSVGKLAVGLLLNSILFCDVHVYPSANTTLS